MNIYNSKYIPSTTLTGIKGVEAEPIEAIVRRLINNDEPITDVVPKIYTLREQGVVPEYNIRSDRFDMAIDMADSITADALLKRQAFHDKLKADNDKLNNPKDEGNPQS